MKEIFSNVGKLFKYNWGQVFKNIFPNNNKIVANEGTLKTMNVGSIVRIVAEIVYRIAYYATAAWLVVKAYNSILGGSSFVSAAFGKAFASSIFSIIWQSLLFSVVPIGLLVYNNVMKQKQQASWVYFIAAIYSALSILYSLYKIISALITFFAAPLIGVFCIAGIAFLIIGNINIIVACIDFCISVPHPQVAVNNNMNQPMGPQQPMMNNNPQPMDNNMNGGYNQGSMNAGMSGSYNQPMGQPMQGQPMMNNNPQPMGPQQPMDNNMNGGYNQGSMNAGMSGSYNIPDNNNMNGGYNQNNNNNY